ncbi:abnormal spindle-like microcephaly-associated protein homolog [Leptopilina boulardi]|uniref:abnormal spindle-like microcephaly-associated protein homolog n=1 Tax=Leptopilina boulardi TaxID=63433 RepID=UPI0021F649CA|nr:abnormal spindle-like microcephaly-associated protein homolog [Leptopilina boulardi]
MTKANDEEMKANKAATKIQAGFRGYRVRKQLKESNKINNDSDYDDVMSNSYSPPSLKCCDDLKNSLEEKSATKIQAGIRGFLVRKRHQQEQQAATRIQAGFRGFRTRKLLKQKGQ